MVYCAVFGCFNSHRNSKGRVSFVSFPKDPALCEQWVSFCNRSDLFVTKHSRICSLHFQSHDFDWNLKRRLLQYTPRTGRLVHPECVPSVHITAIDKEGLGRERHRKRKPRIPTMESSAKIPASCSAMEGTVKVEIEDPMDVKPELDLMPTFERHYVYLQEDPTVGVDLHSATSSVVHLKQDSDPFAALSSGDTDIIDEAEIDQLSDTSEVKIEPEESQDCKDIDIEHSTMSSQPNEDYLEIKPMVINDRDSYIQEIKSMEDAEIYGTEEEQRQDLFPCDLCSYTGKSHHILASHKLRHDKKFVCNQCEYRTHTQKNLNDHLTAHSKSKSYQCNRCSYSADTSRTLQSHLKKHVGKKKNYSCKRCLYFDVDKRTMEKHRKKHVGEKMNFKCDRCKYLCYDNRTLQLHREKHPGVKKSYTCDHCPYVSDRRKTLIEHRKTHSPLKPFPCEKCEYSSNTYSGLENHGIKVHSGRKVFSCDKCSYSCMWKETLVTHKKTHVTRKPFQCGKCAFAAAQEKTLDNHVTAKHSGIKPFQCEGCGYATHSKSSLNSHKKKCVLKTQEGVG